MVYDNARGEETAMVHEVLVHLQYALLELASTDCSSADAQRQLEAERQFSDKLTELTSKNVLQGVVALASYEWGTPTERAFFWLNLLKVFPCEGLLEAMKKIARSKAVRPIWSKEVCEKLRGCFPETRSQGASKRHAGQYAKAQPKRRAAQS